MFSLKFTVRTATLAIALLNLFGPKGYGASYTFTGDATVDAATFGDAHLTGPNVNLIFLSMQSSGPHFYACESGSPCDPTLSISGESGASPAVAFGSLNGFMVAHIMGDLRFTTPNFSVDDVSPGPYTHQEPLTVTGSLIGTDPDANVLFSANVEGTGTTLLTATASIVNNTTIVDFTKIAFTFSGNVTTTPEPSSALLLGGGLLAGGFFVLCRRRMTHLLRLIPPALLAVVHIKPV